MQQTQKKAGLEDLKPALGRTRAAGGRGVLESVCAAKGGQAQASQGNWEGRETLKQSHGVHLPKDGDCWFFCEADGLYFLVWLGVVNCPNL